MVSDGNASGCSSEVLTQQRGLKGEVSRRHRLVFHWKLRIFFLLLFIKSYPRKAYIMFYIRCTYWLREMFWRKKHISTVFPCKDLEAASQRSSCSCLQRDTGEPETTRKWLETCCIQMLGWQRSWIHMETNKQMEAEPGSGHRTGSSSFLVPAFLPLTSALQQNESFCCSIQ